MILEEFYGILIYLFFLVMYQQRNFFFFLDKATYIILMLEIVLFNINFIIIDEQLRLVNYDL